MKGAHAILSDGCIQRTASDPKEAGAVVYLMEELGDARLRCDELVRYLSEASKLIEKSSYKDHFFEVAGNLILAIPQTAFKLQKALQAVALAAGRIDYEELKRELRPSKVQELERVLEDVRIRQVQRRGNPMEMSMQAANWKVGSDEKRTRYEEGEKADKNNDGAPDNIKGPAAEKWKKNTDKYKDKLKKVALRRTPDAYYIVNTNTGKVVDGPFSRVEGDDVVKNRKTRSDQLIQGQWLTEHAFRSAASDEKLTRFEEGKPADPTKNMSPEEKAEWEANTEKYKDKLKKAASFSPAELAVMHHMSMFKPFYRKEMFDQNKLGAYGPDNEHVKSLVGKGLLKIRGKAIVPDKGKIKAELEKHAPPKGYNLTNAHMVFKKTGSIMEAFEPDPAWVEGFLDAGQRNHDTIFGPNGERDPGLTARYEEGQNADKDNDGVPDDIKDPAVKKKWKENTDKYKDKLKAADWKTPTSSDMSQFGSEAEVRKKFKAENPGISDADMDKIVGQWQTHKDELKKAAWNHEARGNDGGAARLKHAKWLLGAAMKERGMDPGDRRIVGRALALLETLGANLDAPDYQIAASWKTTEAALRSKPLGRGVTQGALMKELKAVAEGLFSSRIPVRNLGHALGDAEDGYAAAIGPLSGTDMDVKKKATDLRQKIQRQYDGLVGDIARHMEWLAQDLK